VDFTVEYNWPLDSLIDEVQCWLKWCKLMNHSFSLIDAAQSVVTAIFYLFLLNYRGMYMHFPVQ
jgi:hypothetical protein